MKKSITKKSIMLQKLLCAFVKKAAISGAGRASDWGLYQLKAPGKISK